MKIQIREEILDCVEFRMPLRRKLGKGGGGERERVKLVEIYTAHK